MANYHFTTKNIARTEGRSCVASLAYRSATKLIDRETGETFNYQDKRFVGPVEVLLPENAPQWIREIAEECDSSPQTALQKLADIFEAAEKRVDSRVYREIEFSLPNELTREQNIQWTREFLKEACLKKGMIAITTFHFDVDLETGEAKPHCHVLLSTRELTEEGLSRLKQRDWNREFLLKEWREQYAQYQNSALKRYGFEVQVDHRSYVDRGLSEIEPQPKRGSLVSQMGIRGIETDKQKRFDFVRLKNQFKILRDPELVFSIVTANHSTFTGQDVAKVIHRYIDDLTQFQVFYQRLLHSNELVVLEEKSKVAPVFTTRSMLRLERNLVQKAEQLSAQETHPIEATVVESVIAKGNESLRQYGGLSDDQDRAIRHMLSSAQISCVVGFAGAGKTTALETAQEGWREAGYKVIGLAPTGRAAETLEKSGLRSMTIHHFLIAQSRGREQISDKTVLVIDEAGMIDSRRFSTLLSLVEATGSKIVCIGDGNQLQAVEAGPAFRLISSRVEPAVLEAVLRQGEEWQREATQLFGMRKTGKALALYQEKGAVNIIEEPESETAIETYYLARKISGRIWAGILEERGGKLSDVGTLIEHPDYPLYCQWKKVRDDAVKKIASNFEEYQPTLESYGVDLKELAAKYQNVEGKRKESIFDQIDQTLRRVGGQVFVDTRMHAKKALVEAWARDKADKPEQSHLMLAFSNKDAADLNQAARQLMRAAGEITGPDMTVGTQHIKVDDSGNKTTRHENKLFAQGDRLLFTRNDRGLGVKNGTLGTITSISKHKITVVLEESGNREVFFAPKLYPFIDHGWATTIHKAQGVTVDHVKNLASFEEYRNLAYVGMSRHRQTLQIFGSHFDFWRPEKILDRLSRIQEKLSGVDYLNPEMVFLQLQEDERTLWFKERIRQGRDLWDAIKVTSRTLLDQILGNPKEIEKEAPFKLDFSDSEEKRSHVLFQFKEYLPVKRAEFESNNQEIYHQACQFFTFEDRFGRAPTLEDIPTIQLMGEQLTKLAGRIFQEQALRNGILPDKAQVMKQTYEEFANRPVLEKNLAAEVMQQHNISRPLAERMASLILDQKDKVGRELTRGEELSLLKLADFIQKRTQEIDAEQSKFLRSFQLAQEVSGIQDHMAKHYSMPEGGKLKEIQEKAHIEAQKIESNVQKELQIQLQRQQEQAMRRGMK